MVPLSKTKLPLPTWPVLLKRNAIYLAIIFAKMTNPLFELSLHKLIDTLPYPFLS